MGVVKRAAYLSQSEIEHMSECVIWEDELSALVIYAGCDRVAHAQGALASPHMQHIACRHLPAPHDISHS